MKKRVLFITAMSAFIFISCASKAAEDDHTIYYEGDEGYTEIVTAPEKTEDFLGDFNPIKLEQRMFLVKSLNKLKPKEMQDIRLVPRRNTLELTFHYGVNNTVLILNSRERAKIKEAAELFLTQYENKEIPRHKINAKTAYFNSKCTLYWGVMSTEKGTKNNDYYANVEIFQKHAYFILHFVPTRGESNSDDAFTPKTVLYFSPSQTRELIELMDQDYLNAQVNYLEKKAYTYD